MLDEEVHKGVPEARESGHRFWRGKYLTVEASGRGTVWVEDFGLHTGRNGEHLKVFTWPELPLNQEVHCAGTHPMRNGCGSLGCDQDRMGWGVDMCELLKHTGALCIKRGCEEALLESCHMYTSGRDSLGIKK